MTTTVTHDQRPLEHQPTNKPHTWRTILLAVGLALLLFSCFLTYGLFAAASGWISDVTSADNGAGNYAYYDQQHGDRFPAVTADDKKECQARGWQLFTIETNATPIHECWRPGVTP